jgi:hypothetical protein
MSDNPFIIPLLISERNLHLTLARRCLEKTARDANAGVSPLQGAIDAERHTFVANVLTSILESCGEK